MQEYKLFETVINVVALLAFFLLIFILIERLRLASGREMFTDRFINYLEGIHYRTAPENNEKINVREYNLTDRLKIMELYIYEQPGDNVTLKSKEINL